MVLLRTSHLIFFFYLKFAAPLRKEVWSHVQCQQCVEVLNASHSEWQMQLGMQGGLCLPCVVML